MNHYPRKKGRVTGVPVEQWEHTPWSKTHTQLTFLFYTRAVLYLVWGTMRGHRVRRKSTPCPPGVDNVAGRGCSPQSESVGMGHKECVWGPRLNLNTLTCSPPGWEHVPECHARNRVHHYTREQMNLVRGMKRDYCRPLGLWHSVGRKTGPRQNAEAEWLLWWHMIWRAIGGIYLWVELFSCWVTYFFLASVSPTIKWKLEHVPSIPHHALSGCTTVGEENFSLFPFRFFGWPNN